MRLPDPAFDTIRVAIMGRCEPKPRPMVVHRHITGVAEPQVTSYNAGLDHRGLLMPTIRAGHDTQVRSDASFTDIMRPNRRVLVIVVALHAVENLMQALALLLARHALNIELPYASLWTVVALFALCNATAGYRAYRAGPADDLESTCTWQLCINITVLSALLYFSGGATSPFVSLYVVPLVIAALCLPLLRTTLIGAFCVSCYTTLMFFHVPLQAQHMGGDHSLGFHVVGMWLNFLVSASVITVIISLLAEAARNRARALATLREAHLRNSHVVAIGGMAASAAHALSTPLSTVAIALDEFADDRSLDAAQRDSLELAQGQIRQCRDRLSDILAAGGQARMATADCDNLHDAVAGILQQWSLLHPDMTLKVDNTLPETPAALQPFLADGIATLLDNAAEVNAARQTTMMRLSASLQDGALLLELTDAGGGPAPAPGAAPWGCTAGRCSASC